MCLCMAFGLDSHIQGEQLGTGSGAKDLNNLHTHNWEVKEQPATTKYSRCQELLHHS